MPQKDERQIVNNGGVILEIYLVEGLVKVEATQSYRPGTSFKDDELHLQYYLKENPEDEKLEAAVQSVIEKHVEVLKKALSASAGSSPAP